MPVFISHAAHHILQCVEFTSFESVTDYTSMMKHTISSSFNNDSLMMYSNHRLNLSRLESHTNMFHIN